ncbi:MAG: hypothetical protein ACHQJ6_01990 [Candidatus Berkiellales bacterium]
MNAYLCKEEGSLNAKRKKLKTERNTLLTDMGIDENHSFREQLDDILTEKSSLSDKSNFGIDDTNTFQAMELLNLKVQILYLQRAKEGGFSAQLLARTYPKNLDHRHLEAKNKLAHDIVLDPHATSGFRLML